VVHVEAGEDEPGVPGDHGGPPDVPGATARINRGMSANSRRKTLCTTYMSRRR
jgi:hypothetical protein